MDNYLNFKSLKTIHKHPCFNDSVLFLECINISPKTIESKKLKNNICKNKFISYLKCINQYTD